MKNTAKTAKNTANGTWTTLFDRTGKAVRCFVPNKMPIELELDVRKSLVHFDYELESDGVLRFPSTESANAGALRLNDDGIAASTNGQYLYIE